MKLNWEDCTTGWWKGEGKKEKMVTVMSGEQERKKE